MRKHRFSRFSRGGLTLDARHKKLGGVCAGLANHWQTKRIYVRLAAFGALCVAPEAALIAYGLAYFILDAEPGKRFDDD